MKLNYNYEVKKRKITIELTTSDFTDQETRALNMLGEPLIAFQKTYPGDFTVSLSKKIRSEFKVRVRIDGTDDIVRANEAGNAFLEDIKEELRLSMENLMEAYFDQEFPPKKGSDVICDYK